MKRIIILLILAVIGFQVLSTLYHAGVFDDINTHSKLTDINIYTNVAGTEDLEIDVAKGILFISSTDRWKLAKQQTTDDGIFVLPLNSTSAPVKLTTTYQGDFHPHGISYFSKDGHDYLFVVNHNRDGDFVELFEFKNDQLIHLRSFSDQIMCCANDVVAVDVDKFYVTNDHGTKKGWMRYAEDYLRVADASVLYFDGQNYKTVYDNLNYANGINVSADSKTLYVTEATGRRISVLDIEPTSGELQLRFIKDLQSGVDNITIDTDGNLWIGAHPKLLDFTAHAKNNGAYSPSQVLKLTAKGNNDFTVDEIYLNGGEEISGSSTALYHNGKVYIGVVFENKLLKGSYQEAL